MPVNSVSASGTQRTAASASQPVLRQTSKGAAVERLQSALTEAGYPCAVDGDFGPRTDDALRRFQQDNGLTVDGIAGPRTWAALASSGQAQQAQAQQPAQAQAPAQANGSSFDASTTPSLDRVLRPNCRGEDVEQLQTMLQQAGFDPGPVDGVYGSQTSRAVRDYQASRGLAVDGIVHQQTWGALTSGAPARASQTPPTQADPTADPSGVTLAPAGATESEKYAHYAALVRQNGGQLCPNGQATVLGLRGMAMDGTRHDSTSARAYDDVFVVLTPDGRCYEFAGATHPGQNSSTASPDVTGDGAGDVGTIRPGNYSVVPNGLYHGNTSYHVQTQGGSGSLAGWRDTNHDGVFSDAERSASERRGDALTGVLFHPGNETRPSSIGCQTLSPDDYRRFVAAVGGAGAGFTYTLVDAS